MATEEPIKYPGQHDFLLGRGGETNNHSGNILFRQLIREYKEAYQNAPKTQKPLISQKLVARWRNMNPPGRFLERAEPDKVWKDVGDAVACRKTSKALGERGKRNKQAPNNPPHPPTASPTATAAPTTAATTPAAPTPAAAAGPAIPQVGDKRKRDETQVTAVPSQESPAARIRAISASNAAAAAGLLNFGSANANQNGTAACASTQSNQGLSGILQSLGISPSAAADNAALSHQSLPATDSATANANALNLNLAALLQQKPPAQPHVQAQPSASADAINALLNGMASTNSGQSRRLSLFAQPPAVSSTALLAAATAAQQSHNNASLLAAIAAAQQPQVSAHPLLAAALVAAQQQQQQTHTTPLAEALARALARPTAAAPTTSSLAAALLGTGVGLGATTPAPAASALGGLDAALLRSILTANAANSNSNSNAAVAGTQAIKQETADSQPQRQAQETPVETALAGHDPESPVRLRQVLVDSVRTSSSASPKAPAPIPTVAIPQVETAPPAPAPAAATAGPYGGDLAILQLLAARQQQHQLAAAAAAAATPVATPSPADSNVAATLAAALGRMDNNLVQQHQQLLQHRQQQQQQSNPNKQQ